VNPPAAPYTIYTHLFEFMLQFFILAFGIDVISLSVLDVICSSILLVYMIRLIPAIIIMLYYWLFRIKFYGKLLIYSTVGHRAVTVMEIFVFKRFQPVLFGLSEFDP
jgi:hypothetical protein